MRSNYSKTYTDGWEGKGKINKCQRNSPHLAFWWRWWRAHRLKISHRCSIQLRCHAWMNMVHIIFIHQDRNVSPQYKGDHSNNFVLICSDRSLWGDEWTQTWWAKCPNSMTASPFVTFLISFIQVFPLICHPSVNHFIWMCIICSLFALVGYIASKLSHFTFSYQ